MKYLRKKITNSIMMINLRKSNSQNRVDFKNKYKKLSKISSKINNRSKFIKNKIRIRTLRIKILIKRRRNNNKKLPLHQKKVISLTKRYSPK